MIYKWKYGYIKYKNINNNWIYIENIFIKENKRWQWLWTKLFQSFIKKNKKEYYYWYCFYKKPLNFYKKLWFKIEKDYDWNWIITLKNK